MRFKSVLIPGLCLAAAGVVLFGKSLIFQDRSQLSRPDASVSSPAADVITLHYHERPPYYVTGPQGVYGICAAPAKLAFEKAGIPFRWEKTPARRQLDILRANRGRDCLLGWFKNPEREKFARYSTHIYEDKPTIALALAGNDRIIAGRLLADTLSRGDLTLLRKSGYSYGRFVDALIARLLPGQEITSSDNVGMLKMIHSRRADYFFIAQEEADLLTASSGLPQTDFKRIKFSDMPAGNKRYLLFSKKVAVEEVARIDRVIKEYLHGKSGS